MLSTEFLYTRWVGKSLLFIEKVFVSVGIGSCGHLFAESVGFVEGIFALFIVKNGSDFGEGFELLSEDFDVFGVEVLGLFECAITIGAKAGFIVGGGD